MVRLTQLFALSAIGLSSFMSSASAQSPVLAELYGRGVHAFNIGNTMEAHRYLSLAIDNGSRDPRAYFFRGVVNASTGRQYESEADWQMGAELEAQGEYGLGIGRSLQRVQGSMRMKLENIRQMVRLKNRANESMKNKARYNDLQAAEAEVLRGGSAAPAAPPVAPAVGADPIDNPFGRDDAMGEATPDAANDPFSDDPAGPSGGAAPAGADPFGAPAADPGADPFGSPAGSDTPAPGADPFGGADADMAPAADPFGTTEPAAGGAAPAADPFGGGADPFGGGGDMADPFK